LLSIGLNYVVIGYLCVTVAADSLLPAAETLAVDLFGGKHAILHESLAESIVHALQGHSVA
jgi:hypothetical protein